MFSPDSLPPIIDEVASMALVRGAVVSLSQTPTPTPDEELSEEEVSTGLFESWDWDEAPPQTTSELAAWDRLVAEVDGRTRKPARPATSAREPVFVSPGVVPPSTVTTDVPSEPLVDDDEEGSLDPELAETGATEIMEAPTDGLALDILLEVDAQLAHAPLDREGADREDADREGADREDADRDLLDPPAVPALIEPRPPGSGVDWPPPRSRPGIDYPPDWSRDDLGTMIVIDPHRSGPWRQPPSHVLLMDLGAWFFGFAAMFFMGLATTTSVALVLFALSL